MRSMHWVVAASLLAGLGVALGAFGAHGLQNFVDERGLKVFETAVRYQMYHAFAIFVVVIISDRWQKNLNVVNWLFASGIAIFSGSLYILVLSGQKWLGAITPIGGLAFLLGWICLAWISLALAKSSDQKLSAN